MKVTRAECFWVVNFLHILVVSDVLPSPVQNQPRRFQECDLLLDWFGGVEVLPHVNHHWHVNKNFFANFNFLDVAASVQIVRNASRLQVATFECWVVPNFLEIIFFLFAWNADDPAKFFNQSITKNWQLKCNNLSRADSISEHKSSVPSVT